MLLEILVGALIGFYIQYYLTNGTNGRLSLLFKILFVYFCGIAYGYFWGMSTLLP